MSDESGYPDSEMKSRLRSLGYVGDFGVEQGSEELAFRVSVVFELK